MEQRNSDMRVRGLNMRALGFFAQLTARDDHRRGDATAEQCAFQATRHTLTDGPEIIFTE